MDRTEVGGKPLQRTIAAGYLDRRRRVAGTVFTVVWLLYLVPSAAYLFRHHYSAPYIAGGLAIMVAFSVIYSIFVPSWPMPSRYVQHGLAALALLAVVGCVFYGAASLAALWIFMASATGLLVRDRRWAARAVTGCVACYVLFSVTTHFGVSNTLSNLLVVVCIGYGMMGLRSLVQVTAELARAREEVAQLAANEERLRLARDMHDLTGQSLSTITLKSELAVRLLERLPDSPERDRVLEEIEQAAAVSRQTLRDIREAISGYRRPTLAVEIITARAALASAGIAVRDDADLTLLSGTFDPDAEAALAWCLREAVTNVVRHSGASNCRISLSHRAGAMSLTVRDDGTGYSAPDGRDTEPPGTGPLPQPSARHATGTGLHGMAERLTALGGALELRPDAHPGFRLVATVPAAAVAPATPAVPAPEMTSLRA